MDEDYDQFHQHRTNLRIHIFAVPMFIAGTIVAVWFALSGAWLIAAALLSVPVISMALQGAGHRKEPVPPRPFTGPANFVGRILAEQFFRFPLFVVSGRWAKALRAARDPRAPK